MGRMLVRPAWPNVRRVLGVLNARNVRGVSENVRVDALMNVPLGVLLDARNALAVRTTQMATLDVLLGARPTQMVMVVMDVTRRVPQVAPAGLVVVKRVLAGVYFVLIVWLDV